MGRVATVPVLAASNKEDEATTAGASSLWITYINIVLYALCYQLQRPVEPFLVQELSKNSSRDSVTQTYGQLQSFFSIIQTLGSPLVGILLDRMGIRKASATVFAASAASYAILSYAVTMRALFYSKIPTALQHAFLVAQAVAATSCQGNEAARAQALGRMTTAYTVGATLGPALGGFLAQQGDLYIGAKLAVVGSLLSVVLSLIFLPDVSKTKRAEDKEGISRKRSFVEELKNSAEIAMRSALWPLLAVKVISGVASSMYDTALPMVLTQQLHFDPATLGLAISCGMFASAAFGAFGIRFVTRILGARGVAQAGLTVRPALSCMMAAIVSSSLRLQLLGSSIDTQIIIAVAVVHGLASHALATGLTTQTTGAVGSHEQGALLGLEHGLFSMARIGGPALGTSILTGAGFWAVASVCATVDVSLLAVLVLTASHAAAGRKSKYP
jgi:predicted MFS family arabinose efflux permease